MTIDLPRLKALWQLSFGDTPEFVDRFFATGFSPERCQILCQEEKTVAALYWFDCLRDTDKFAYIYAVATHPDHRGQGLCRQLMDETHRQLQSQGYAGAVLVPGSRALFSLYKKLGYLPFSPAKRRTVSASAAAAPLTNLSPADYYAARLKRLPENTPVQPEEAIRFLATYCGLYQGNGFLCSAALDEETVYFQEFWGDPEKLPEIVTALGGKTGKVRLPGGDTPFAMYQLFGKIAPPAHFSLPLD